jgi:hypothetical protein
MADLLHLMIMASDEYTASLENGEEREPRETLLEFIKRAKAKAFLLEDNGNGKNRSLRFEIKGRENDLYLPTSSKVTAAINSGDLKVKDLLQFEVGSFVSNQGKSAGKTIVMLMMPATGEGKRTGVEIPTAAKDYNSIVA